MTTANRAIKARPKATPDRIQTDIRNAKLIRAEEIMDNDFVHVAETESLAPADLPAGNISVPLNLWLEHKADLLARDGVVGVGRVSPLDRSGPFQRVSLGLTCGQRLYAAVDGVRAAGASTVLAAALAKRSPRARAAGTYDKRVFSTVFTDPPIVCGCRFASNKPPSQSGAGRCWGWTGGETGGPLCVSKLRTV